MKKVLAAMMAVFMMCTVLSACGSAPAEAESSPEAQAKSSGFIDNPRVSYLGPAGTYTEEAAQFFFADGTFQPKETVPDAIADVTAGYADYAVIPQENTLGGAVVNYVDALFAQEGVYVVGEVILPISQTLMGVPGASLEDIETVCSHVQGITQSAEWRKEHLPNAVTQEMASTAAAASYVAETGDKTIAAVAAPGAAELYGLTVLAENVQITDNIIVEIHNTGAELVTIHDRPEGSMLSKYNYIIEIENKNGATDKLLEKLGAIEDVRILGRFRVAEKQTESHTG